MRQKSEVTRLQCASLRGRIAFMNTFQDSVLTAFSLITSLDPVLAGIVQVGEQILLARNAAWPGRRFALITGFMEAGESPEEGIRREIAEETNLQVSALKLIGVYDFQRMNQVIIAYHAVADGEVRLSPELAEYKMFDFKDLICWPAGTGYALADWLRTLGIEPTFMTWQEREMQSQDHPQET